MRPVTLLLVKFVSCMVAFAIGLDIFFDATIVDIVSFSLAVTIISYIGDKIILPRFGNRDTIVVDFIMTYMSVWIFGSVLLDNYVQIGWGSVIAATIVTTSEVFVHRYVLGQEPAEQRNEALQTGFNPNLAFGTEFAEEEKEIRDHKEKPKEKK
ncbi:YndM family protein [Risungbinella massiliensis]|uniref:YndM family protein n=1 Tax=Risungbinella massiliensis TaxID=1329796 RepID=UPI0005CC0248|nr:YndM family protein [Risungbinella massiliensis]